MTRSPYWLSAAVLAAAFLAQTLALPHPQTVTRTAQAARVGAQLGAIASMGVELPARADPGARATATPEPSSNPTTPAAQETAVVASEEPTQAPTEVPTPTETPPPTPTPPPDRGKLIVIDPGHGGKDPGAVHTSGGVVDLTEEEVNLDVALRLAEMLRQDGYRVQLTRSSDQSLGAGQAADLQARVDVANAAGADVFVAIHHNGSVNRAERGTEVYYCSHRPYADANRRLAKLAQEAIVRNLRQAGHDAIDRGAKDDIIRGHLALLGPRNLPRPSRMPAIIGEALFMTNDADAAALKRPEIREAIARGYFEALKAYFESGG